MKKSDFICLAVLGAALCSGPAQSRLWRGEGLSLRLSFFVFALAVPLGEAVARRLASGSYPRPAITAAAGLAWGLYGLGAVFFFRFFNLAAALGQAAGLLPGGGYPQSGRLWTILSASFFSEPFFTGLLVSFCYTQPFLGLYRWAGAALNLRLAGGRWPDWTEISEAADWPAFFRAELFLWPLFRALGLTVVFMAPSCLWLGQAAWLFAALAVPACLAGRSGRPGGTTKNAKNTKKT